MGAFDIDMDSIATTFQTRRSPFLGTICLNPAQCETCNELVFLNRNSGTGRGLAFDTSLASSEMRRVTRVFVNAIDMAEVGLNYPVRVLMLPKSVFYSIMNQFKTLYEEDSSINILHPESGRDIVITRTGFGMQTRYSIRILPNNCKIPNTTLYNELMNENKSRLYELNKLHEYFNAQGELPYGSPIVKLDYENNQIRLLPPYNNSQQFHIEYGFHYATIEQLSVRYDLPRHQRPTQQHDHNTTPISGRELMVPREHIGNDTDTDELF